MKANHKKILLVATGLGRTLRGFETYIAELATLLERERMRGFEVVVYGGGRISNPGFRYHTILNIHRQSRLAYLYRTSAKRLSLERTSFFWGMMVRFVFDRPAAVYLGEYSLYCQLFHLRRLLRLKYSLVLYTGGQAIPGLFDSKRDFVHHITDYYLDACAHLPTNRQALLPHFIYPDFIIKNELFSSIRTMAGGKKIILSVGAIENSSKRMGLLVQSLAKSKCRVFPILLGEPTADYQDIELQLTMHFGKGGYILAKVPKKELGTWYQVADAFVLCSPKESFGLVLLEAMYHGLPVACTRFEEVEFVLQNNATWLDNKKPEAWAGELADFFQSLPVQPQANLVAHQYCINRFSWQALKHEYLAMFREVLR